MSLFYENMNNKMGSHDCMNVNIFVNKSRSVSLRMSECESVFDSMIVRVIADTDELNCESE